MIFALVKRMSASSAKRIRKLARKSRAPDGRPGPSRTARRRTRSAVATAQHRQAVLRQAALGLRAPGLLLPPAVQRLRLAEGLRRRRLGRRVVRLQPARRLVVRVEPDGALTLCQLLRAFARQGPLAAHL